MSAITHDDLKLAANTIRGLAMDGVQKAKSGHPGMPMGMADVAAVLFLKHLKHCPSRPDWADRDRFVLSAGHGSMLIYSLLHLSGYDLPLDELKQFRQWGSRTPGHPEAGHTVGVETTTGPLGQGIANAVGMALAERMLAARFNREGAAIVDHHTYAICGDGCLMEGISHEACSLAGHLKLERLILFYDSNHITIEGATDLAYSDNVKRRFQGYNWNVIETDAHDYDQIDRAIRKAQRSAGAPTLVICHSQIGKGSPNKQGKSSAHGEPLGDEEVRLTKLALGLPENESFHVPERVRELFAARAAALKRQAARWDKQFAIWAAGDEQAAAAWEAHQAGTLPADLASRIPPFDPAKPIATRSASGKVMQAIAKAVHHFVGGSADLAPSTKTFLDGLGAVAPGQYAGRNLHFGVREHAMGALLNGMALHKGFTVFGATFFVFADYCRPAVRLSAIMGLPVVYVFTHDSFYVGEDGPTHEPVEHAASLRCIPNMTVIRPADATETAAAWVAALKHRTGPTALLLTRHDLPVLDRATYAPAAGLERGGYTLWESAPGAAPQLILIATGSEVSLALEAARELAAAARVRVVSLPSWELFERQDAAYRAGVLPPACRARVAVEAGATIGWLRYVGERGAVVGLDQFGASAPYKALAQHYGFTPANVVAVARAVLAQNAGATV